MRRTALFLLALAALFLSWNGGGEPARADELLHMTSSVHYSVDTEEPSVSVTWNISLKNNDPETQFGGDQVFFYEGLTLPLLPGADAVGATSADGISLTVGTEVNEPEVVDRVSVTFDRNLFFGDTYEFTVTYRVPETRNDTLLVTPAYIYVPLIALGDEASVSVSAPSDAPWETDIAAEECAPEGAGFRCSGSDGVYLAGVLELSRSDSFNTIQFDAPVASGSVNVRLTHFGGEDELAAHQREVIQAALPLIEEAYGIPLEVPTEEFSVFHGGRQMIFGYEGITNCVPTCAIVISPISSDQTLIHELAHLWSAIYESRWLSEGFAEWVARQASAQIPDLVGEVVPYPPSTRPLQLDEWGEVESLLGADEEYVEVTRSGYDLSLRFVETLEDEIGADGLRSVNARLAEAGAAADSRDFMDALEDVTGLNPDALFMLWVFPESERPIIEQRREARDRLAAVASELAGGGFPDEPLLAVREAVGSWQFAEAMTQLDGIEADLGRYAELSSDLEALMAEAGALGLVVPGSLASAIERWEFDAAEDLMSSAGLAIAEYDRAQERVAEPRSLWQKFGLIGEDPESELAAARESFDNGSFGRSREQSGTAIDMVDGASEAATRRVLALAIVLAAFAIAFGLAYWLAVMRQRGFGEEA